MALHLPSVLSRVYYRYPVILVDAVTAHEPGSRLVAFKNVTVNEEFFQGHFPGSPLMPGVMLIEALTQAAMHSHYHRAQNATRLRELRGAPPLTDLIVWWWKGRPEPVW